MTRRPPRSPLFPSPTLSRSRITDARRTWGAPRSSSARASAVPTSAVARAVTMRTPLIPACSSTGSTRRAARSEEHTSELQSPCNLVCRLLLEKKKNTSALRYQSRIPPAPLPLQHCRSSHLSRPQALQVVVRALSLITQHLTTDGLDRHDRRGA